MRALRTAATSLGWLAFLPAWAQSSFDAHAHKNESDAYFHDSSPIVDNLLLDARHEEVRASYPLSRRGDRSVFGYIGSPAGVALGPSASFMRTHGGLNALDAASGGHWLYPVSNASDAFTVGYEWRHVTVERSIFSSGNSQRSTNKNLFKLDSRSVRLSYKMSSSWTLQLSRGSLSGLDQLVPNGDVRRTTVSATYRYAFPESEWQTTLAWGRNARKSRETVIGYLLESTYRFSGTNVVFGRLEQVGSDELVRENESLKAELFKMNKLTVGYFRDVTGNSRMKLDIGILASRHFVPSPMSGPYGTNPVAYMAFIRFKPQ